MRRLGLRGDIDVALLRHVELDLRRRTMVGRGGGRPSAAKRQSHDSFAHCDSLSPSPPLAHSLTLLNTHSLARSAYFCLAFAYSLTHSPLTLDNHAPPLEEQRRRRWERRRRRRSLLLLVRLGVLALLLLLLQLLLPVSGDCAGGAAINFVI